jgi:hypothetical protein
LVLLLLPLLLLHPRLLPAKVNTVEDDYLDR